MKTSAEEKPSAFKHWINEALVEKYAKGLKAADATFDDASFLRTITKLKNLEMRGRVRCVAEGFHQHLSSEYEVALKHLLQSARSQDLRGFELWPVTEFIQMFGVDHFSASFEAMKELTVKFTAEFSVRVFLKKHRDRSFRELSKAAKDENVHLRRWASEGSRPRLPWGERLNFLIEDPTPSLKILEALKFDSELYVRKSVSNHLNDIAKDHPELVIETLSRWRRKVPSSYAKEFKFIVDRSLRTLIKKGHPGALRFIGVVPSDPQISVKKLQIQTEKVKIGHHLEFTFNLCNGSKKRVNYVLDYALKFRKANGSLGPKVFKLKKGTLPAGESLTIQKRHSFKPITTKVYYAGEQRLEILVNGRPSGERKFMLIG